MWTVWSIWSSQLSAQERTLLTTVRSSFSSSLVINCYAAKYFSIHACHRRTQNFAMDGFIKVQQIPNKNYRIFRDYSYQLLIHYNKHHNKHDQSSKCQTSNVICLFGQGGRWPTFWTTFVTLTLFWKSKSGSNFKNNLKFEFLDP